MTLSVPEPLRPMELFTQPTTAAALDAALLDEPERKPSRAWVIGISLTTTVLLIGAVLVGYTLYEGIGLWGNNRPVFWAFAIINFVFWIGIGHAGTLISAILLLFRASWRNAISRFAEAMTIFAVSCAGLFPIIHMGRPWVGYWIIPYPNERQVWSHFRSPLLWDVFAISTYFLVSLLFWYLGLVPDLASMRERTRSPWRKRIYGVLCLGWRGAASDWHHYEKAYTIVAGLATGLVLSVHSVVSFDFATSIVPGWHMTIFPPYFVVGAIFAGFAMVDLVLVVVRKTRGLEHVITDNHLDVMNKLILAMSCLMAYAYLMEGGTAWYSSNLYIRHTFLNYVAGDYGWAGCLTILCNTIIPQLFWFRRCRRSIPVMIFVAVAVTLGMWMERFVIIVVSLHQDYLPSSWHLYAPTWVDIGILCGSFGLFFTLVLLFARFLPVVSTTEEKTVLPGAQPRHPEVP